MSDDRSCDAVPWLRLRAAGTCLRSADVLADPALAELLVDDLCWDIAMWDWSERKPRRWQCRRLARWRREQEALWQQRGRLREQTQRRGLSVF